MAVLYHILAGLPEDDRPGCGPTKRLKIKGS
jgi:hypothetical protein